jgi:hypothetical protein
MKFRMLLTVLILLGATATLLVGCKDSAQSYVLVVECDDAVSKKSVEVDLIGVTPGDKSEWEAYSVTKYWEPDDKKRGSATDKVSRKFGGADQPRRHVLSLKNPDVKKTWSEWMSRGVTEVIVIANLRPGYAIKDEPGNADPRRKNIPLKPKVLKELYPDAKGFRIFVQDASVRIDPLDKVPKDATK